MHDFFEPQGNDGRNIRQRVEECGRNLVLAFVDFPEGLDKNAIEADDNQDRQKSKRDSDRTEYRGEVNHGAERKDELSERIQINEAVLKKSSQCFMGFS